MATLLVDFCRAFVRANTVAGAAIAGMWLGLAALTRATSLKMVVFVSAMFVAVHAIFFSATRYRAPMEFVLLFYAAVAIDHLVALAGRGTVVSAALPASIA